MRSWMREHSLECSQSRFTAGSLSQGKHPAFAELKAKVHNARVMLALDCRCFQGRSRRW